MLSKHKLENNQIWIYFISLLAAAGFGFLMPRSAESLESIISIVIAVLLYSMFSQIPFTSMKESWGQKKFIKALLTTNFIIVPIVVWLLARLLPQSPELLIGFYLVLLTPCIDYVIVFTALGKGDERLMLASTPILLIIQLVLLPLYLWMFLGRDAAGIVDPSPFLEAFLGLIFIPLITAVCIQLAAKKSRIGAKILSGSAWLPVPFMAFTLFAVAASQLPNLPAYANDVVKVIPLYVAFMIIMPFLSKFAANWFKLGAKSGRTLIFSSSTRNSLVVLPLAFSLPEIGSMVAALIITQTIIELMSELIYIRFVPHVLLRDE
ncbi:arsenic resistance protein [Halobacillus alkaliphilus]|uniref:arsenic resistance protein n=1 Tax=Halobacillus alkaliphilus TaxID=396056 RepID=UPI000B7F1039|nr:bile acid:sodium symporter [Halobacillus alkaliphilus]